MLNTHFNALTADLDVSATSRPKKLLFQRTWSYGDVENNGVYYHPQLTHYAHQAFEEFFATHVGLQYVDLSRDSPASQAARNQHAPSIPRMTFPVEWLYQWMLRPMVAGDRFEIGIDFKHVSTDRVGVRAWTFNASGDLAAVVIWLRAACELEPRRKTVPIPPWFPR